jgi:hypothetical protein
MVAASAPSEPRRGSCGGGRRDGGMTRVSAAWRGSRAAAREPGEPASRRVDLGAGCARGRRRRATLANSVAAVVALTLQTVSAPPRRQQLPASRTYDHRRRGFHRLLRLPGSRTVLMLADFETRVRGLAVLEPWLVQRRQSAGKSGGLRARLLPHDMYNHSRGQKPVAALPRSSSASGSLASTGATVIWQFAAP